MSWWGTIYADFATATDEHAKELFDYLWRGFSERYHGFPTGSETGPTVRREDLGVTVDGRLRDVTDENDAADVLAWVTKVCRTFSWVEKAMITVDFDGGPRYVWRFADGQLTRVRGVLDR